MTHVNIFLSEQILDTIAEIGKLRRPAEACGVLLPTPIRGHNPIDQVVELPNRSDKHHDEYSIYPGDIQMTLEVWSKHATVEERNAIAVWHTHPQGNAGPSRGDMQKRIEGVPYLVVAINPETDQVIPSWF